MAGFPVEWLDETPKCWNTEILFLQSYCPDFPLWCRPKAAVNVGWDVGLVDLPLLSPSASLSPSVSLSGALPSRPFFVPTCPLSASPTAASSSPLYSASLPHPVSLQTSAEVSGLLLTPFLIVMAAEQGEAVCGFLSPAGAFEPWPQATTYRISDLGQIT